MKKIIIVIGLISFFHFGAQAKSLNDNKKLQFKLFRGLASPLILAPVKKNSQQFVFLEGHNIAVKPTNKQALQAFDFFISVRVPLN